MSRFDNLGSALRAFRHEKGWTQLEVARRFDISRPALSMLEAGRFASLPKLDTLLDAYGKSLHELADQLEGPRISYPQAVRDPFEFSDTDHRLDAVEERLETLERRTTETEGLINFIASGGGGNQPS